MCAAFLCLAGGLQAQPKSVKEFPREDSIVKTQLEHIFKLSAKKDCRSLAPMIAYKGADAKRKLNDVLNYADSTEREQADGICSGLADQEKKVKKITYDQFFLQKEKDKMWYYWKLQFAMKSGDKDSATFGFIKLKDKFVLATVNQ